MITKKNKTNYFHEMNTTVNCSYFLTEMFGQQICAGVLKHFILMSVSEVLSSATVADGVEAKALKA